jgi:uncharacterized protein YbjT (DUF2867 family)
MNILVLGATGYIGGRLVPRLAEAGHAVRVMARSAAKAGARGWTGVEILSGDVINPSDLDRACRGIEVVYYLVHSMAAGEDDFEGRDRILAANVASAASRAGVGRIIYLGGLGKKDEVTSAHLRSRHEVGDILRAGTTAVTEFRAAVIIGSGSASFEMIHHLVNRLPVMVCPRWVLVRTQPISVRDVIWYLIECLGIPETGGRVIDIGGPDILTYREMMITVARALGLKRRIFSVPVLTPRLSSYWVNLVSPIPIDLARALIESLRHETVCEDTTGMDLFNFRPMGFSEAVDRSLEHVRRFRVETTWAESGIHTPQILDTIDPSHLIVDRNVIDTTVSPEALFRVVSSIGGDRGWYYADWMWRIRGFIDKQLGGVGLRRGRRHPVKLTVGEALDFWRVEALLPGKRLLLRAEMIVWGHAWLEFTLESVDINTTRLVQRAIYYPHGLAGLVYWYCMIPFHLVVFRGLLRTIVDLARREERISGRNLRTG